MSNAKLITSTTEDIKAFADKIANSDRPLSKQEILNMYAAATQGPKTVWGGITNAKKAVVSQRASEVLKRTDKAPVAAAGGSLSEGVDVKLVDEFYEGKYSLNVKVKANDTGVSIETDNGQEVVVEYYEDKLSVRMYNDLSDSPVSLHSQPGHQIASDVSGYHADRILATEHAPVAGSKKGRIIGYQVSDMRDGVMYADKSQSLVLTYAEAEDLLDQAYDDGHENFMLVAVHEGEIQEPIFSEDEATTERNLADVKHVVLQCYTEENGYQEHCGLYEATGFNVYLRVPTPESEEDPYDMVDEADRKTLEEARDYARQLKAKHNVKTIYEDLAGA
jgi:hypothetical protein